MISCLSLVNVYGLNGKGEQALDLYHRIPKEYISEITSICILNACSHSGLIDDAYHIFAKISDKTSHIYSTMVNEESFNKKSLFDANLCSLGRLFKSRWFVRSGKTTDRSIRKTFVTIIVYV